MYTITKIIIWCTCMYTITSIVFIVYMHVHPSRAIVTYLTICEIV